MGGNKNKIIKLTTTFIFLLIFSISFSSFISYAQVGNYTIFGYVRYSNGEPIPDNITVLLTDNDIDPPNTLTVETKTFNGITGYYYIGDVYVIDETRDKSGDEMTVSVDYGGCTGSEIFVAGEYDWEKINITIEGNLPPNRPNQPLGPNSGYTGITYNYSTSTTDLDDDQIYYWFDWDDGTNSGWIGPYNSNETCNISKTWNDSDTFSIKIKAKDTYDAEIGNGWSTTLNVTITNPLPIVNFTYTPANPKTTDIIQFNDSSTDENGYIASWYWDFKDGTNSIEQNPTHQYYNPGSYQVTLTVTDNNDGQNSYAQIITVTGPSVKPPSNKPPIADFTYSPSNPKIGSTINFYDNSNDSDGTIEKWFWDFGDGTNSTEQNPVHTYKIIGEFNVNLTVTDDDDASDYIQKTISVSKPDDTDNKNILTITLRFNAINNGNNYLVWRGNAIKASTLAASYGLTEDESIGKFDIETGQWEKYIIGFSEQNNDFVISTYDIILITVNSEKNIRVEVSKTDMVQNNNIAFRYSYDNVSKTGNPGLNYVLWPVNNNFKANELAGRLKLLPGYAIYKYDQSNAEWVTYIYDVDLNQTLYDFTINEYDILCIYVPEEITITLS